MLLVADATAQDVLMRAVTSGDHEAVRTTLGQNSGQNAMFSLDGTYLESASSLDDIAMVLLLLRAGASTDGYDSSGGSWCDLAVNAARNPAANPLENIITSTHDLIVHGKNDKVIEQLARGESIESRDSDRSWTLLHSACAGGNVAILDLLLKLGANPNVEDIGGQTPLHLVVAIHPPEMTRMLLEAGAEPNVRLPGHGLAPIHFASLAGNRKSILHLLTFGADVNVLDNRKWSVLHICALKGDLDLAKLFIEYGATGVHPEIRGLTPNMIAAGAGYLELANLLASLKTTEIAP